MSLTLPQIPPEVREKIFKEVDHEKILSCLEIEQWKDIILDYLYNKAIEAQKDPRYYALLDKLQRNRGEIIKFFDNVLDPISRQLPELTPWCKKEPVAWYISAKNILSHASTCNGAYIESEISGHTPLHNVRVNSNLVCYVRNHTVAVWRRATQSQTFLEPHGNHGFHSWTCKTNIELLLSEKYLATAVPDALPCGRPSGAICIKIFCATSLRLIRCFHSDKLWKFPSIQLLSIDESGTILLSVWDRLETSEDDTRHVTYFCAFKNSLNLHHLENVETSSGDIQENPNGGFSKIYLIDKVLYKVSITSEQTQFFGSQLTICCFHRNLESNFSSYKVLLKKPLFSAPTDFGLVKQNMQNFIWIKDELQFQMIKVENSNLTCFKKDLRCKVWALPFLNKLRLVNFRVHNSNEDSIVLSYFDPIRSSLVISKLTSRSSRDPLAEHVITLKDVPSGEISATTHSTAVVLQSEDRLNLRVVDFLLPFLS